jgi:hypothetical protein
VSLQSISGYLGSGHVWNTAQALHVPLKNWNFVIKFIFFSLKKQGNSSFLGFICKLFSHFLL